MGGLCQGDHSYSPPHWRLMIDKRCLNAEPKEAKRCSGRTARVMSDQLWRGIGQSFIYTQMICPMGKMTCSKLQHQQQQKQQQQHPNMNKAKEGLRRGGGGQKKTYFCALSVDVSAWVPYRLICMARIECIEWPDRPTGRERERERRGMGMGCR